MARHCRICRGADLCRRAEAWERLQQRHRLLAPRALVQQHLLRSGVLVAVRSVAVQALTLRLGVTPVGLLLLLLLALD